MIIDPKKTPFKSEVSSENPREQTKSQPATSFAESRQVAKPQPGSSSGEFGQPVKPLTKVFPLKPLGQAKPLLEKSLKRSPLEEKQQPEKSVVKSNAARDKNSSKKILAVGGAKGGVGK